ncbi:hypothetical protein VTN00DRAFT_8208 [Thermoascus crustaceus]|uniref:uncharacterized protein n=1 Tax=Thermoascus crustaceus TaxID=5088 RepID=UPI003744A5AD
MVHWRDFFDVDGGRTSLADRFHEEHRRLLPSYATDHIAPALPSKEVTKVALRLKYQIEQVIPCELESAAITNPNSTVITKEVIQTAREAGGEEYRACVVYCLLVCLRWFKMQALVELWDSDLHDCRALACEVIAKRIIETEEDQEYLLQQALLKRYSIFRNGEESEPANVVERAVDLHALRVIGSSGYQKCIKYLWHGWLCQDDKDPTNFIEYKDKANPSYWAHVNPDRMRVPVYQNVCQIFFSLLYLALYTAAINTVNPSGNLDITEGVLYTMTLGFMCDELNKFRKVGRYYFSFWNAFNSTLYALLTISFVLRMIALTHSPDEDDLSRRKINELSYNFLAFSAPMFWMRLMLYLDTFRFFGVMLVVLKVMMKESLIFFALLFFVLVGFLQAFIGLNQANLDVPVTGSIIQGMLDAILQSPEFGDFQDFAFPFGIILYYIFTFLIMVLLLNILIALYNSAYTDIADNAVDEYMALFAAKTMQFVRAPDENVFIPPLNLIEIIFLILPFEWWLRTSYYERLNNYIMGILYSPLLLLIAFVETCKARRVQRNRSRGEEDDEVVQEWEAVAAEVDFDETDGGVVGWSQKVQETKPNVQVDTCTLEVRQLKEQVKALTEMVRALSEEREPQTGTQSNRFGETANGTNGTTDGETLNGQVDDGAGYGDEEEGEEANGADRTD